MKKLWIVALMIAGFGVSAESFAGCPEGYEQSNNVRNLMKNKYLCASRGSESWQEYHAWPSGILTEYKLGPDDPVDPSEDVGTWWADNNNSKITHVYNQANGGGAWAWAICVKGSGALPPIVLVDFNGTAYLKSGNGGC